MNTACMISNAAIHTHTVCILANMACAKAWMLIPLHQTFILHQIISLHSRIISIHQIISLHRQIIIFRRHQITPRSLKVQLIFKSFPITSERHNLIFFCTCFLQWCCTPINVLQSTDTYKTVTQLAFLQTTVIRYRLLSYGNYSINAWIVQKHEDCISLSISTTAVLDFCCF